MTIDQRTRQFIAALHAGGQHGYWWTVEGRRSFWWDVGTMTPLPGGRRNVYFGVHPTSEIPQTNARGEPKPSSEVRSQITHIAAIGCLFCEYDAKDYGDDKQTALQKVKALDPPPSVVVDSGGGYHCYYLLAQPWVLKTGADREKARKLQAAWVRLMDGDPQSKDLARVLRVPGTLNHKYQPARRVAFVWCNLDARYAIDELAALAQPFIESDRQPAEHTNRSTDRSPWLTKALAGEIAKVVSVRDGLKHERLLDSAIALGGLVHLGLSESEIENGLYGAIEGRAADPKGARKTILDGIAYGKQRPREIPPKPEQKADRRPEAQPKEAPTTPPTDYAPVPSMPSDVNDLLAMERKPVLWYAPSFLREGLGLLVGQPNVGKTPAAIQLAIAIATGGKWLNAVLCRKSKVLYLGMEYSPQELIPMFDISRMGQSIPREQLLVKTIEDDFPTNAEAALAELEWYLRVMEVKVIIIDVLTAFLPPEKFKQNVYRGDYSELKPYHRLALQYNAAILGVWHASKRESDPKIMYNGSTGMWAAAASRITMYQDQEQRVRIAAFPRMGDRLDWALTQEKSNVGRRWVLADAAPDPMCSPTELQIFRFLKERTDKARAVSPGTIAEMTGLTANTVRSCLLRLFERNIVQRGIGNGYYVEDATPATDATLAQPATDATLVTDVISVASATDLQRADLASGSPETGALQALHDSTCCNDSESVATSPHLPTANGVPLDYVPSETGQAMIERLMKRKNKEEQP